MRFLAVALAALTLVSCNRDPNYLKQRYLESGKKYYDAGRYREASIMFRKAIDKDRRYGDAYYNWALTNLKTNQIANAVPALRRAVELLKPGTADSDDAILKLSEIMVVAAQSQERNEQIVKEVTDYTAGLLKRNPKSWQGLKLSGDLDMLDTVAKYRKAQTVEAKAALGKAVMDYRSALSSKPGDYIITLALGRTLVLDGETAEAENLFRSLVAKDKTNLSGVYDLYRLYIGMRRFPEAETLLKTSVKDNPKDTSLRLELARFYFGTNNRDSLIALLNQMKANLKDFPEAYMQAGDFFLRVNQFDEAIRQYEEGVQKDPKQKNTYLKHEIEAYVRQNKLDLARAKNDEILKSDPKDPDARPESDLPAR